MRIDPLPSQSKAIFFDVTELFLRTRKQEEVTGIQRVVLELAHELCAMGVATPVVAHPCRPRFHAVSTAAFDMATLYDGSALRKVLGKAPKLRRLVKYRRRPLMEGLRKLEQEARLAVWAALHDRLGPPVAFESGHLVLAGGPDINHRTAQLARYLAPNSKIHAVIHDAIPIRRPHDAVGASDAFRSAFDGLVALDARLIAVSHHAAADLTKAAETGLLAMPSRPITVLPLAAEIRPSRSHGRPPPDGQFVLMVGPIHGRKNAAAVFAAVQRLLARGVRPPTILCAGRLRADSAALFREEGAWASIRDHVVLIDQPDHATLHGYYKAAAALIYPSLYEGYGLPVGEALWLGTPVLSSNATSLPEAGGTAPIYFDPDDVDTIADLLGRVASDREWLDGLRQRSEAARPSLRSWRDTATTLLDLLRGDDVDAVSPLTSA